MGELTKRESGNLVKIIAAAIQLPGVKVNRENFLLNTFKDESVTTRNRILEQGPVKAGIGRRKLERLAEQIINTRTIASSTASFAAGLPGGFAMAATIPADTLQFFGVSGASAAVRVVSSALGKQALKKLPQMALTKTFYYPIVKSIAKAVGVKMTKGLFAKGVSKAIPIVGGVVSGGITFVSMRPMGKRLAREFDEVHYDYSAKEFEEDWESIVEESNVDYEVMCDEEVKSNEEKTVAVAAQIKEAKELLDAGILSQEEFEQIKKKLIADL